MNALPYIITVKNRVEKVNKPYLDLTGYTKEQLLGRTVGDVLQQLLRISADINKIRHLKKCNCYMFDICRRVKDVTISYAENPELKQCIYTFRTKKNSVLEDKYPFLELANSANDMGMALYSVPDFVLLKGNESYRRYCRRLYGSSEDIIGKRVEEIIPDWEGSSTKNIFSKVVSTCKPMFCDENMKEYPGADIVCTRYTLTPIIEEDRVRYLVLIHNDVTEKVKIRSTLSDKNSIMEGQKNYFEKQRDYLYNLFNTMRLPIISFSFPEYYIKEFNKKALSEIREFTGIDNLIIKSDTIGKRLAELIPSINLRNEDIYIEQMNKTKSSVCHKRIGMEKKGRKVYYDIIYHPFIGINEEITEVLIVE